MTSRSRAVVQAAWQAFASHDAVQIAAYFTQDAEWLAPAGNATAVALDVPSHMVGRNAIAQFIATDFPRLFIRDVVVDMRGLYADGDQVIVEETMRATLANGNAYANDYCFVFELRDGLICRVREYMDTARGHREIFGTPDSAHWPPTTPKDAPLPALHPDCRAVMNHFVYSMVNGLLGYPVLESVDYRAVLMEEGSAAEQACAIFCNVLELDANGRPVNANEAEIRAAQYIRHYCDRSYEVDPPFEDWEIDRPARQGKRLGPMP